MFSSLNSDPQVVQANAIPSKVLPLAKIWGSAFDNKGSDMMCVISAQVK